MDYIDLGLKIRQLRRQKSMTQEQLAEMAGISMRYAVEADAYAAASYKRNFKNATVFCEDIRKLSADKLNTQPVFIIMGGPPCQGFSLSNTKTRDMSNPNNRMFEEFLRFVDKIAPTWFVFENVYGLTKFKNGEENIQNHIENRFRAVSYTHLTLPTIA